MYNSSLNFLGWLNLSRLMQNYYKLLLITKCIYSIYSISKMRELPIYLFLIAAVRRFWVAGLGAFFFFTIPQLRDRRKVRSLEYQALLKEFSNNSDFPIEHVSHLTKCVACPCPKYLQNIPTHSTVYANDILGRFACG